MIVGGKTCRQILQKLCPFKVLPLKSWPSARDRQLKNILAVTYGKRAVIYVIVRP